MRFFAGQVPLPQQYGPGGQLLRSHPWHSSYRLPLPHCMSGLQVRVAQPGAQQYGPDGQMHQRYLVCQVLAVESRQPGYYK